MEPRSPGVVARIPPSRRFPRRQLIRAPIRCRVAATATVACAPAGERTNSCRVDRALQWCQTPTGAPTEPGPKVIEWGTARREVVSAVADACPAAHRGAGIAHPFGRTGGEREAPDHERRKERAGMRGPCPLLARSQAWSDSRWRAVDALARRQNWRGDHDGYPGGRERFWACRPKLLPCGRRATRGRHHRHRDRGGQ